MQTLSNIASSGLNVLHWNVNDSHVLDESEKLHKVSFITLLKTLAYFCAPFTKNNHRNIARRPQSEKGNVPVYCSLL